jgi:hypothetical protein
VAVRAVVSVGRITGQGNDVTIAITEIIRRRQQTGYVYGYLHAISIAPMTLSPFRLSRGRQ